jgi:hypothetical protein
MDIENTVERKITARTQSHKGKRERERERENYS